jgi:hypothetical protein
MSVRGPDPDGRIGARDQRLIGNQRICQRNKTPALPLEHQRNSYPLSARVARVSCPRRTLASSPEPISQRPVSLRRDPSTSESECEGDLSLPCALSTAHGSSQRSGSPTEFWLSEISRVFLTAGGAILPGLGPHTEWVPFRPIAHQCSPCCQRGQGIDFAGGPLGPEGVCWSRRRTGCSGARARRRALAYVSVTSPAGSSALEGRPSLDGWASLLPKMVESECDAVALG